MLPWLLLYGLLPSLVMFPVCSYPRTSHLLSHSGGSSLRSRVSKKPKAAPAPSKPRKKMSATKKRKGKESRKSYSELSSVEFATLRQRDWYTEAAQDPEIEDPDFWCKEQLYIFQDIYMPYKFPIRPMRPIHLSYL